MRRFWLYAAVVAGAAIMLFPFLWTVITSITPEGSLAEGPKHGYAMTQDIERISGSSQHRATGGEYGQLRAHQRTLSPFTVTRRMCRRWS